LQVATDLGRVAVGPGSLDKYAPGVGVPRLSDAPLTAALPGGVFTRDEAQVAHELAGVLKARQVAQFGNERDRSDELHAAQGLNGLHDRRPTPALHQGGEFR